MITVKKPTPAEAQTMQSKPIWSCGVSEFDWYYDSEETHLDNPAARPTAAVPGNCPKADPPAAGYSAVCPCRAGHIRPLAELSRQVKITNASQKIQA